jgi:hypothetical protein
VVTQRRLVVSARSSIYQNKLQRRVFKSGKVVAPVPASQAALRDFDKLTKRIRELESEEVETRVSREGAKLNSIQQYLQTETVNKYCK